MSFLTSIEAIWQKDETWIINFLGQLKKDVAIVEADLLVALSWMSAHGSEIAADVTGVIGVAASLGLGLPAPVVLAVNILNTAVAAVNAAAAAAQRAKTSGTSDLAA